MILIWNEDKIKMFLFSMFDRCLCKSICPWPKREKLMKLLKRSETRLAKDLNIFQILKTLKLIKVAMRHSLLTDKVKFETFHSKKCLIDLDSNDEDISQSKSSSEEYEDSNI